MLTSLSVVLGSDDGHIPTLRLALCHFEVHGTVAILGVWDKAAGAFGGPCSSRAFQTNAADPTPARSSVPNNKSQLHVLWSTAPASALVYDSTACT